MVRFICALAALAAASATNSQTGLSVAEQAREHALEKAWSQELAPPAGKEYQSPIKRVVSLLEKMRAELVAEADKEAEMYDKMVCWCETNEKEKKKAIADAEALEKELEAEIQERAAKFGEDATEIDRLKEQISEDTASLKEATSIRENEAAKFRATNKDLVQSITNVKNAIQILSKHNSAASSFVQLDASVLSSMHTVLKDLAFKAQMLQADQSEGRHSRQGTSFLSLSTDSTSAGESLLSVFESGHGEASGAVPLEFAQRILAKTAQGAQPAFIQSGAAPSGGSYAPQSSQIFGILTTMKEEFEANLSQEEKDELKAQEDFAAMSKAKSEQIAVAKEKLDALEGANADNQKALSDAKENLELTREQRSKDVEFLRNLKTTCMDLDQQWAQRSKTRAMETQAVSEALKIVTADDNMDLLRGTVTLLQVNTESQMRVRRSRAMTSLRQSAQSPSFEADDLLAAWHSRGTQGQKVSMLGAAGGPRMQLSTLAVSVGLDSFAKIKEAMDKMVSELKVEQEEEVKFKTYCAKELNLNEKQTYETDEQKEDLEASIAKLSKLIKKLAEEIADANNQIAETETAILKASQVREGENAEFQTVVADQRATQDILTKALGKLKAFYKSALLQKAAQEPPVKFNSYKKNAGASPVIGMIEQIIEDSKALEGEAVAGETEAQASYEQFVKDSNALIKQLSDSVAAKTKASATAKEDAEQAKSDLEGTVEQLESLALTAQDLHGECDWVLRNFAARQKARLDEIEAIGQAKAILSGEQ
jgi:chromosome segregation ATPase